MVKPADQKATKRPRGICCPTCSIKLHTHRVIPLASGVVRRVRRCKGCGHECSTTETPALSHRR